MANTRSQTNSSDHESSLVRPGRRLLLHPFFVSIGGSLLIAAFGSDIMYANTSLMQWSNASDWLIAVGLVMALFAAIALLIDVFTGRGTPISWLDFALLAVAAFLSIVNEFVHSRDAWTSVVPEGIWLSGIVALLLLLVAARGWCVSAFLSASNRGGGRQ